jgi:hypothetical protein
MVSSLTSPTAAASRWDDGRRQPVGAAGKECSAGGPAGRYILIPFRGPVRYPADLGSGVKARAIRVQGSVTVPLDERQAFG